LAADFSQYKALVIIPARMASTRLPGKPLADIHGVPMIVQVWRRAMEAQIGPVVVAAAESEIVDAIRLAGGQAILTRPDHPSGSDRIFEAWQQLDPRSSARAILNLQGDLPTVDPATIRATLAALADEVDISTACAPATPEEEDNPNVVKAVVAWDQSGQVGRALYFTRARAPTGPGPLFHHIGLYAYRPQALARFVRLPPSPLEIRERLEQLRALESGMKIAVARVDSVPLGVDTPADLARARALLAPNR
jgi:3-deoxy-manno-octulosonate cytidylyltransferase (CMP-KDO synthetase)